MQIRGCLEIVTQAVLLSALLCYWVNRTGMLSGLLIAVCAIAGGQPLLAWWH